MIVKTEGQQAHGKSTQEKMLSITNYLGMQLKTTMRYHLTPVRRAVRKKSTNSKY